MSKKLKKELKTYFKGVDIETLSRDELIDAFKYVVKMQENIKAEALRLRDMLQAIVDRDRNKK